MKTKKTNKKKSKARTQKKVIQKKGKTNKKKIVVKAQTKASSKKTKQRKTTKRSVTGKRSPNGRKTKTKQVFHKASTHKRGETQIEPLHKDSSETTILKQGLKEATVKDVKPNVSRKPSTFNWQIMGILIKILRFFNISQGEFKRLAPTGLLLWLLMAGLSMGRAANDSLFIGKIGAANIPQAYIVNAIVLAVIALTYSLLEKRLQRIPFFMWIIAAAILILVYLRSQVLKDYPWVPYATFAYYEALFLLVQIHFWTCINDIFGPREGKRLFPYIGGLGLLGTVSGGLMTWLLAPLIGLHNLFVGWILLLAVTIPVLNWTKRTNKVLGSHTRSYSERERSNIKQVWDVSLVRFLAWLSIPLWFVVHTIDWLFYLAIEEMYVGQPDQLSAFLGLLAGLTSFLGIILQSFISGPILRKMGVSLSFSLYAISMTVNALLFIIRGFAPVVSHAWFNIRSMIPVAVRFLDETVFLSIYDSSLQLLYGALPAKMRGQARSIIYGVMETSLGAIVGIILTAAVAADISPTNIAFCALILGIIWTYFALRIKKHYLNALALAPNLGNIDSSTLSQLQNTKIDAETRKFLLDLVYASDQEIGLLALRYIKDSEDRQILMELGKNIENTKGLVLSVSLNLLCEYNISEVLPNLKNLYLSNKTKDRAVILNCICKMEPAFIQSDLNFFLGSSEPSVRATVVLFLMTSKTSLREKGMALRVLKAMASLEIDVESKMEAIKIVGELRKPSLGALLLQLTKDTNPKIRNEAMNAMGMVQSEKIVRFLISQLEDYKTMHQAIDSLVRLGSPCLPILHEEVKTLTQDQEPTQQSTTVLKNLIACLSKIAQPASMEVLASLLNWKNYYLEEDVITSLSIIRQKHQTLQEDEDSRDNDNGNTTVLGLPISKIQKTLNKNTILLRKADTCIQLLHLIQSPKAKNLLSNALKYARDHFLQLTLRCLQIIAEPMKVNAIIRNLDSNQVRLRSEAIEILEGLNENGKALSRVLENYYKDKKYLIQSEEELLKKLAQIKSYNWLSVCIAHVIGEAKLRSLLGIVEDLHNHSNHIVQTSALLSLRKLGSKKTDKKKVSNKRIKDMSTQLEKVLFLRSIPVFADVKSDDLLWISNIMYSSTIPANKFVFYENESGNCLYIIQEGEIHIRKGKKGDVLLAVLQAKDYFGEIAIFDQQPRTASALTTKETTLLSIDRYDFQRLVLARPELALAMLTTLSRRLRDLTSMIDV